MIRTKRLWSWAGVIAAVIIGVVIWIESSSSDTETCPWGEPLVQRDLDAIAKDTLRVLVLRDPLSWEQRPQATTGLEFEMLERFARSIKVPLVAIPVTHPDSMLMDLQAGRADLIAAQCTERKDQRPWFAFTTGYATVRPMLARLRGEVPVEPKVIQASAVMDSVITSAWSPFTGERWKNEVAVPTMEATPEELLMDVVLGRSEASIVTDVLAAHEAQRFPILEFIPLQGSDRDLRFTLRKNSPDLLKQFNAWLADENEREARTNLLGTYTGRIGDPGPLKVRRGIPVNGDSISPFDAFFHQHAHNFRWGWELLCVMAWKESRFDSTATSHMGAQGIMQLMPRTSAALGLDSAARMGDHIRVAARYMSRLDTLWMRAVPDREQRLRFALASYNAGPGHVIDAQRLAEHLGLDPNKWEDNVERAVLLLAKPRYYMRPEMKNGFCKGSEVFNYVRDVVALYHNLKARPKASMNEAIAQETKVD